jgi:hypothetical protein
MRNATKELEYICHAGSRSFRHSGSDTRSLGVTQSRSSEQAVIWNPSRTSELEV